MRKSKPLTANALAEPGADRLAAMLLYAAEHDAAVARTLRIAVAARGGADSAAAAIDAEIRRLKRGTSLVDYGRMPAFARDLSALCAAIEGPLADADPGMALERMFDFHRSAPALIERSDDSDGYIGTSSVRRARWPPCWRLGLPRRCPPNAPVSARTRLIFATDRRWIIAAFAHALDPPTRTALCLWIALPVRRQRRLRLHSQ
jgi:hypothetical protein